MADALVSFALEKLNNVLGQQLALFSGATVELQRLQKTFHRIRAVLNDAESKQVTYESVRLWLFELRRVSYDIDDLLEELLISGLEKDGINNDDDGGGEAGSRVCAAACLPSPYTCLDRTVSRYKLARNIKEIRKRLDEIAKDKDQFNTSSFGGDTRPLRRSRTMTSSHMKEEMMGRDDDKYALISRLVGGSSSGDDGQRLQVIAIAGIGGLGKTTLARKIYQDGKVSDHFKDALYWVCVSEDFDPKRLTKAIIEQVNGAGPSLSELHSLQNELVKALNGKRFLLVLDDVWNDDKKRWNTLEPCLESGAPGSRVLVTTRLQKVVENTMKAAYIHELKGLSEEHSWMLFSSIAFVGRTAEECLQLESVGREIVSKCKGVPLSITVMGSVMNSKKTLSDWQNILGSNMWSFPEAENEILPALWLSYYNLPAHLKQCFVYCSIYPKDQVMYQDELVKLWIAQGLVQLEGNREIEDIGVEHLNDLVGWSMLQKVEEYGVIKYTMHDLLHDLAKFVGKDEIFTFVNNSKGGKSEECPSNSDVRHAFLSFTDNANPLGFGRGKKLRTLIVDGVDGPNSVFVHLFHQARFLKAVIFKNSDIATLPKAIGKMKHLRYLDLSSSKMEELPEAVSDLRSLHTLNLNSCLKLKKLPWSIGGMVSLRHLQIEGTDGLDYLPKGLGRISCLQSLCKFMVGGGDERRVCGIGELQQLNSLRGSLEILNLERVSSRQEAEIAQLWNKRHLRHLRLGMSEGRDDGAETGTIDSVLEGLQPHENLEKLGLDGCIGSKLPNWMEGMRRLRKLELYYGPKLERVPHLSSLKKFHILSLRNDKLPDEGWGQLVALQKLMFENCKELKCLPEGLTQLPSLEQLDIKGCDKLESLPEGLGELKELNSLTLIRLVSLRCVPDSVGQLESLESLCISSCEKLESLPVSLGQLKKLKSLHVGGSKMLRCVPDSLGRLESLKHLCICDFKKLESLPISLGQLKKLNSLHVGGSEVLRFLPDSVGQLESLEHFIIYDLKKLESVPDSLGQLKALSQLEIWDCEALASLPQGLCHLSLLRQLWIYDCPLLRERCLREGGVDWPNISHIPNIIINYQGVHRGRITNKFPIAGRAGRYNSRTEDL